MSLPGWLSSSTVDRGPSRAAPGPAAVVGAAVATATAVLYLLGSGRAYGLDEATSVARFIATPSLLDPFQQQVVYNNHVLLSFLDHLVYSLAGSQDETLLRLLPVGFAAAAMGLLTYLLSREWGRLAGATGGAIVATSPLLIENGRQVRGYSLLVLSAIVATALFLRLRQRGDTREIGVAYVIALAGGIATHLYTAALIPVHASMVTLQVRGVLRWSARWALAVALGLAILGGVLGTMVSDAQARTRVFDPQFPIDLVKALLGRSALTAVLLVPLLALGAWQLRRQPLFLRAGLAVAALIALTWVAAPRDLYPRFFVWLVPAVGLVAARAIARHRWAAVLGVAVVITQLVRVAPSLTESDLASRDASDIARQAQAGGARVCTFGLSSFALEPYLKGVRSLPDLGPGQLRRCDVVVQVFTPVADETSAPRAVALEFPSRRVLPAQHPGVVRSRRPLHN